MAELSVTIVGLDLKDLVMSVVRKASLDINPVKSVNKGRLGNFKTLTWIFEIDEYELIQKRRAFMDFLAEEKTFLTPMYEHGDWCSVYIFGKWAFQSQ